MLAGAQPNPIQSLGERDEHHLVRIQSGNKENAAGQEGWQRKEKHADLVKSCVAKFLIDKESKFQI